MVPGGYEQLRRSSPINLIDPTDLAGGLWVVAEGHPEPPTAWSLAREWL